MEGDSDAYPHHRRHHRHHHCLERDRMKFRLSVKVPGATAPQELTFDFPEGTTAVLNIDGATGVSVNHVPAPAPAPAPGNLWESLADRVARNSTYGKTGAGKSAFVGYGNRAAAAAVLCGCWDPANHMEGPSAAERAAVVWGGTLPVWESRNRR